MLDIIIGFLLLRIYTEEMCRFVLLEETIGFGFELGTGFKLGKM